MNSDGNFTYTTTGTSSYLDKFTVTVSNGNSTVVQPIFVNVSATPPVVEDMSYNLEAGQTIDTATDTTGNYPNALSQDADADGATLRILETYFMLNGLPKGIFGLATSDTDWKGAPIADILIQRKNMTRC
jgi:hypothetical protein